MNSNKTLVEQFSAVFGCNPDAITRAPGRVNLLGEHTDYNEGFVLPVAIDRHVRVAARRRDDRQVRLYSSDFDQSTSFELTDSPLMSHPVKWSDYVQAVAAVLMRSGHKFRGMDAVIAGDIPLGAGLSSSAALELATLTAFSTLNELDINPVEGALLCQQAENNFVGVQCGIMDQFTSSLGQEGQAIWLDCRDLAYEYVPLPPDVNIVIVDSGQRRELASSAYNQRRAECESGARWLGVRSLREITGLMLENKEQAMPPKLARRCRHVVEENRRVLAGVDALRQDQLADFGALMNASHDSLRDLFQVSTDKLDRLVATQHSLPGCLGVRLTGAGFGGCTVALVLQQAIPDFTDRLTRICQARMGEKPSILTCRAAAGAGVES